MSASVTISTPTRLHFGLLHVPVPGSSRPAFGGLGAMIDTPCVTVTASPATEWSVEGTLKDRAENILCRMRQQRPLPSLQIIADGPAEHTGFGVGTALSLALAKAVAPHASQMELIQLAGRGLRSRVGLEGFFRGGFHYDAGHGRETSSRIIMLPRDWCFAIIAPPGVSSWHGGREQEAFARARDPAFAVANSAKLESIIHNRLLPAASRPDHDAFAQSLGDYNRLAGEPFAAEQGGPYASIEAEALIGTLQSAGFPGSGQSSWGPTIFVCLKHAADFEAVRQHVPTDWPVTLARIDREGAIIKA